MNMPTKQSLITIHRLDEIPSFGNEAEEHAFWATHELSDDLWDQSEPLEPGELPPPRPSLTPVVINLDQPTLDRVKALARRRRQAYQKLLADLVAARLADEEQRTG
jgi:hypothetical protein